MFDGELWRDNIALRDYLKTHPDAVDSYAAAKRAAAALAPTLLAYSDLKRPTPEELLQRARAS